MPMNCTRCEGSGFLNLDHIPEEYYDEFIDGDVDATLKWMEENDDHSVQVCDCCGNGEDWYDFPGEHYNLEDPIGENGPYAYNGGLCECH